MTSEESENSAENQGNDSLGNADSGPERRYNLPVPVDGVSAITIERARRNPLLSWLRQNGSTAVVAGMAGAVAGGLVAVGLGLGGKDGDAVVVAKANGPALGLTQGVSYETTGSIPIAQADSAEGWTLWRVRDGRALVQGESGYFEVAPGSILPGLGLVQKIEQQDGNWVVETPNGLITPSNG